MKKSSYPSYITRYFWGDNLSELNFESHRKYMTETLLNIGDIKSIKWLLHLINRKSIKDLLPTLKMSKKSRNFWQNYL